MLNQPTSLKESWLKTPGPYKLREFFALFLKGILMGIADLIPGVSGGTIAFIVGIYQNLLNAVSSFNKIFFIKLFQFRWKEALSIAHVRFLLPLLGGILTAIFSLARLMHYLLNNHKVLTWSVFLGLIGGSIIILIREQKDLKRIKNITSFIFGIIIGHTIINIIPIQTPEALWFITLCGMIGISAMILPGISGSFLLLILGKYAYITSAIRNPFDFQNFLVLIAFTLGSITGLLTSCHLLKWLLKRYYQETITFLTGLILISTKKLWPWKEVLKSEVIMGKTKILQEVNVFPESFGFPGVLGLCLNGGCIFYYFIY